MARDRAHCVEAHVSIDVRVYDDEGRETALQELVPITKALIDYTLVATGASDPAYCILPTRDVTTARGDFPQDAVVHITVDLTTSVISSCILPHAPDNIHYYCEYEVVRA